MVKFIHTADWQIGKPFARIEDAQKRAITQRARIEAIARLREIARSEEARFVVVAGDLFDSPSPREADVSNVCHQVGQLDIPLYSIPGNHDHAGPGSLWEQRYFLRERERLAPNWIVITNEKPLELEGALLLPCPLRQRHELGDTTQWIRNESAWEGYDKELPRIVLAHGSVQDMSGGYDDEEESGARSANLLDLTRLPQAALDYIALGDWHGTKQVGDKAWYSGTPEIDRFPKGETNRPGNILLVEAQRGELPRVKEVATGALHWHELAFECIGDETVAQLEARLTRLIERRVEEDLLLLSLSGTLGMEGHAKLDQLLANLAPTLLRLKLRNSVAIAPTEAEIEQLTLERGDPLIASVATELMERVARDGEESAIAALALRELFRLAQEEALP